MSDMHLFYIACVGLLLSGLVIRLAITMSYRLGLIDRPGEHKQHSHETPFVGGIGIYAALLVGLWFMGQLQAAGELPAKYLGALFVSGTIMFVTGLVDDIFLIGFKIRLALQSLAILIMIWGGGVLLVDLGAITPAGPLQLHWLLALSFTVFAAVGVINALNMIDGIDGLSGSIAFISLALLAFVGFGAGHSGSLDLSLALLGGVAGFLYFNMRYGRQRRARTFMGDNGTMLLGFLFAWLFISMSQGPDRAMSPITAPWLFSIPLMDTVGVMLRRIWLRKSPFHPDRHHLHHLFMNSGFTVRQTVWAIALIHLALGLIGVMGDRAGVPESVMFIGFLGVFAVFFYLILRPWRCVPFLRRLHGLLGLVTYQTRGVVVGRIPPERLDAVRDSLSSLIEDIPGSHLHIYRVDSGTTSYLFAILEVTHIDNDYVVNEARRLLRRLRLRCIGQEGMCVHPYESRKSSNDRRSENKTPHGNQRIRDRRHDSTKTLLYSSRSTPSNPGGANHSFAIH